MKVETTIELSEAEVEQAVREYVSNQGHNPDKVILTHEEGGATITVETLSVSVLKRKEEKDPSYRTRSYVLKLR